MRERGKIVPPADVIPLAENSINEDEKQKDEERSNNG
jgi:hypothetical protein